ncbi:MAG: alcohol dehydrogenase catalytic domain-containing protein [Novosphingobium sp.]|nr:alcohol dehydrogenase catalytic domain-containing protein [Novosphingobium sp.]MCP5402877.1 alcohol dehydrogenase catalytic domain-containing protein [Novosphingobium sp.]
MKVLNIHEVNDVRLDDYVLPEAGPNDVVVKMKACGICGSDLSYIKYGGIMREPGGVTPIGHEGAGEVLSVGPDVSGVSVGDPVIINPMMTPSNIGSGGPEGAFVDELLVRDAERGTNLLPIPEGVPYDVAAMCEPLAVAMHGVNRMEVKPGDKVVVFGCGPIGLGMVLWLVDRGITDVIALDLAQERLDRALALGARAALNPAEVDIKEEIGKLHGTEMCMHKPAVGTDAYIDAAGAPRVITDVINMAKYHSRLVITAAYMQPFEVPFGTMLTSEMTITTAVGYPTEMPEVVAAMPRLKDKIRSLISHHLPFDQVLDGLKIAGTPESAKVMIEFEEA